MLKAKFANKRASALALKPFHNSDTVRVFVGNESREFTFSKELLSSASPYFASRLDASGLNFLQRNAQLNTLWLEDLCPDMFELFGYWLNVSGNHHNEEEEQEDSETDSPGGGSRSRSSSITSTATAVSFQPFIDEAYRQDCCEELHWDLINLHLFAARIDVPALQDAAMDAVQDLYLACDWEITPRLVSHVYTECDAADSHRLRRWMVAMAAWSWQNCSSPAGVGDGENDEGEENGQVVMMGGLFEMVPEFRADYLAHLDKSSRNRTKLQFKNPQLRLPSNNLRNEERQFGFRQCSFHTHRSTVGQGPCPHTSSSVLSSLSSSPPSSFSLAPAPTKKNKKNRPSTLVPGLWYLDLDVGENAHDDSDPSDSEQLMLGDITGTTMVLSPSSAIFELYLDIR